MIAEIIAKWDKNKSKLEEYFKTTEIKNYDSYESLVVKVIEIILNDEEADDNYEKFNIPNMTIIDHGDYQGTKLFIIPKSTYQPSVEDYIMTHNEYGSCSGCDTLQSITQYNNGIPTDKQVSEFMTLSLHLIQRMKYLS